MFFGGYDAQRSYNQRVNPVQRSLSGPKLSDSKSSSLNCTDIAGAQPKKWYPEIQKHSYILETKDIQGNSSDAYRFKSARSTNPLKPTYKLATSITRPITPPKFVRDSMNIEDIAGTRANKKDYSTRDNMGVADILGAQSKNKITPVKAGRDILCVSDIKGTKSQSQIKTRNDKYNTLDYSDITHKSKKFKTGRKVNPVSPEYDLASINGCCIQLENTLAAKNKRNSAPFKKAEYSPLEKMVPAGARTISKYMFSGNRQNSNNQEGEQRKTTFSVFGSTSRNASGTDLFNMDKPHPRKESQDIPKDMIPMLEELIMPLGDEGESKRNESESLTGMPFKTPQKKENVTWSKALPNRKPLYTPPTPEQLSVIRKARYSQSACSSLENTPNKPGTKTRYSLGFGVAAVVNLNLIDKGDNKKPRIRPASAATKTLGVTVVPKVMATSPRKFTAITPRTGTPALKT